MTLWFGEAWPSPENPAPVCDPLSHMPTPVGQDCTVCHQPIQDGDRGVYIPLLGEIWTKPGAPWHLNCFLDNVGVPRL